MYVFPQTLQTAKKPHNCTWCGQKILMGERYSRWASVDDSYFTSKMHEECVGAMLDEFRETRDNEYLPFENERPAKLDANESSQRIDDTRHIASTQEDASQEPSKPRACK